VGAARGLYQAEKEPAEQSKDNPIVQGWEGGPALPAFFAVHEGDDLF
jgi:hypothetical protein